MKTTTKKSVHSSLVSKYDDTLKWISEIESWKQGNQFMKVSLLRHAADFTTEEEAINLWTFNEELTLNIEGELDWLEQKIHKHQLKIRSFFKVCQPNDLSKLNMQHHTLQAQSERFKSKYQETRMAFFDLLKPVLKRRISERGNSLAA